MPIEVKKATLSIDCVVVSSWMSANRSWASMAKAVNRSRQPPQQKRSASPPSHPSLHLNASEVDDRRKCESLEEIQAEIEHGWGSEDEP